MHLPFGPVTHQPEQHSELPEVVAIEDLTAGALDAAAQEIAAEQEKTTTWPTTTA